MDTIEVMFCGFSALVAVLSLALPQDCAVCRSGDLALCERCRDEVAASLWHPGPRRARPDPEPAALPPVHACGRFEGALAGLVTAYKDGGRRDCAPVLAGLLADAVDVALQSAPEARRALAAGDGPVLVVPVPSSSASRRRRGDAPLEALAAGAVSGFAAGEVVVAAALRVHRRVADQAGLGAQRRHTNVEHSMVVRSVWAPAVRGATCVVVDDVLTTGATLGEAARALRRGGAGLLLGATICATQRRVGTPDRPSGGSR